jgi:hypothetical protein
MQVGSAALHNCTPLIFDVTVVRVGDEMRYHRGGDKRRGHARDGGTYEEHGGDVFQATDD